MSDKTETTIADRAARFVDLRFRSRIAHTRALSDNRGVAREDYLRLPREINFQAPTTTEILSINLTCYDYCQGSDADCRPNRLWPIAP